ncbi:MAG: hypothetical protein HC902_03535 [Calothrix sp. SM1_5_4]|nr:hypothetical protein [Calothrix sp. SM1_5_4]
MSSPKLLSFTIVIPLLLGPISPAGQAEEANPRPPQTECEISYLDAVNACQKNEASAPKEDDETPTAPGGTRAAAERTERLMGELGRSTLKRAHRCLKAARACQNSCRSLKQHTADTCGAECDQESLAAFDRFEQLCEKLDGPAQQARREYVEYRRKEEEARRVKDSVSLDGDGDDQARHPGLNSGLASGLNPGHYPPGHAPSSPSQPNPPPSPTTIRRDTPRTRPTILWQDKKVLRPRTTGIFPSPAIWPPTSHHSPARNKSREPPFKP